MSRNITWNKFLRQLFSFNHLPRLCIISDHTGSYKNSQLFSNVTFAAKRCEPRNDFSTFRKHGEFGFSVAFYVCIQAIHSNQKEDPLVTHFGHIDAWGGVGLVSGVGWGSGRYV